MYIPKHNAPLNTALAFSIQSRSKFNSYIEVELEATHSKNTTTTNPQQVLTCSKNLERGLLRVLASRLAGKM